MIHFQLILLLASVTHGLDSNMLMWSRLSETDWISASEQLCIHYHNRTAELIVNLADSPPEGLIDSGKGCHAAVTAIHMLTTQSSLCFFEVLFDLIILQRPAGFLCIEISEHQANRRAL